MHPNPRVRLQQQRRVRRRAEQSDAYAFFNLLTGTKGSNLVIYNLTPNKTGTDIFSPR